MNQAAQRQRQPDPGAGWQPLLTGELRARALAAVRDIARELPDGMTAEYEVTDPAQLAPITLAEAALFYGYLAQAQGDDGARQQAIRYLNLAFAGVAGGSVPLALYGGISGVGWTVAHLAGRVLELAAAANCEPVDELVNRLLARSPWRGDYDLIGGLVGYGVYALERLPQPAARAALGRVLDRLEELAEHQPDGVTWFTPPRLLPEWQRAVCPGGYYNLGLAHGAPGVISLLAQLVAADIETARVRPLLDGAARWLLSHELPPDVARESRSRFPSWAGAGVRQQAAKLSWCYGDLGAAAALLDAGLRTGRADWRDEALAILRQAAARTFEQAYVVDACLCHGSAGNAHIFNRIYQATGEAVFAEAAQRWFARALEFRTPGTGIAGFPAFWADDADNVRWVTRSGLLEGAIGIGLALLAACTETAPDWDRLLLVSLPVRTGG